MLDHIPSPSPIWYDWRGSRVYLVLPVHGLGALVVSSLEEPLDPEGKLQLHGVALFDTATIRSSHP